jgi:hypothetical protein
MPLCQHNPQPQHPVPWYRHRCYCPRHGCQQQPATATAAAAAAAIAREAQQSVVSRRMAPEKPAGIPPHDERAGTAAGLVPWTHNTRADLATRRGS